MQCHTALFTTANSSVAALRNEPVPLYSDLLVHDMGAGLADGVSQGAAGGREFRTAPLWGLGQRIFFLHDGRTSDLIGAIRAHASSGSEASGSVMLYNALSEARRQDSVELPQVALDASLNCPNFQLPISQLSWELDLGSWQLTFCLPRVVARSLLSF